MPKVANVPSESLRNPFFNFLPFPWATYQPVIALFLLMLEGNVPPTSPGALNVFILPLSLRTKPVGAKLENMPVTTLLAFMSVGSVADPPTVNVTNRASAAAFVTGETAQAIIARATTFKQCLFLRIDIRLPHPSAAN